MNCGRTCQGRRRDPLFGAKSFDQGHEVIGKVRVELGSSPRLNLTQCLLDRPWLREWSPMGQGIENIGKGHDARMDGNALSCKLGWIASTVPPLVMMMRDLLRHTKLRYIALRE